VRDQADGERTDGGCLEGEVMKLPVPFPDVGFNPFSLIGTGRCGGLFAHLAINRLFRAWAACVAGGILFHNWQ